MEEELKKLNEIQNSLENLSNNNNFKISSKICKAINKLELLKAELMDLSQEEFRK